MAGFLELQRKVRAGEPVLAVGLMSGTSADGIDAAVVRIQSGPPFQVELLHFDTLVYPHAVRNDLFACFRDELTVSGLCALHARVGEWFAAAAEFTLAQANLDPSALDFVASHGQTVWHQPPATLPDGESAGHGATLQIGEAARIAERLRVPVVSDFRQQDMAAGGQGAPLIPFVDYHLLRHPEKNRAVQNIGGIGNVAYLPAGCYLEEVTAFDTGPGNVWIDAAAALVTGGQRNFDEGGALARAGTVDAALLAQLMAEPYLLQHPPKSTGRELFTVARVRELWDAGHQGADLVATLTQFTAESIADAYRRWLGPVDEVIVAGGGARNPELLARLERAVAPAVVRTHEALNINSEAKEALGFAILAWETLRGAPSNVPSATGAARAVPQGKITLP